MNIHNIIAPPPTPNGGLHIGHLSGPYLHADIFKKYLELNNIKTNYVVSTDDHQSYVDITASKLNIARETLITNSRNEIKEVFNAFSINLNKFSKINENYKSYALNFFASLYSKKIITKKFVNVLYDNQENRYAFEAFIYGRCPNCLSKSAGGICESCGHPNNCLDLVHYDKTRYEIRVEERLVFKLDTYKERIKAYLDKLYLRPSLYNLINELFKTSLPDYVISYNSDIGIKTDFAGLPEQRINVWAEMYAGHIFFLQESFKSAIEKDNKYTQFLGFDNSYFYVILHLALGFAAKDAGLNVLLPTSFITNQFYNLGIKKFSTSQRHVLWAIDFAKKYNPDSIRIYLAKNSPEFQENSFIEQEFIQETREILDKINLLINLYNSHEKDIPLQKSEISSNYLTLIKSIIGVDEKTYCSKRNFDRTMNLFNTIIEEIQNKNYSVLQFVPQILKITLYPLCPNWVSELPIKFKIIDFYNDNFSIKNSEFFFLPQLTLLNKK